MILVTLEDCRDVRGEKYCAKGMRYFFASHGLDWDEFRKGGLPVEQIEQTGDAMALQAAENARARVGAD